MSIGSSPHLEPACFGKSLSMAFQLAKADGFIRHDVMGRPGTAACFQCGLDPDPQLTFPALRTIHIKREAVRALAQTACLAARTASGPPGQHLLQSCRHPLRQLLHRKTQPDQRDL